MQNHVAFKPFKLPKEYLVGDDYLVPNDTVTVSVLDHTGNELGKHYIDAENGFYTLPATHLGLAELELAKPLFLQLSFTIDDINYDVSQTIRLIRFKPITITPTQLRSQVGATTEEMPDSGFDIYGSYLELCERVGTDIFADATRMMKANRLILLHTLIKELPTLSLRLLSSRAVDDHKFTRNRINVQEIGNQMKSEYELLLINDFNQTVEQIDEPLLIVVPRPDPFSGV